MFSSAGEITLHFQILCSPSKSSIYPSSSLAFFFHQLTSAFSPICSCFCSFYLQWGQEDRKTYTWNTDLLSGRDQRIISFFSLLLLNSMIKSWFFADNFSRLPITRLDNEHLVFWWLRPPPPRRSLPPELIGTFSVGVQFSHVLSYKEWHSEISIIHHHAVFPAFPQSNYTTHLLIEWFTLCHSLAMWFASPWNLFLSSPSAWNGVVATTESGDSLYWNHCYQVCNTSCFTPAFSPIKGYDSGLLTSVDSCEDDIR